MRRQDILCPLPLVLGCALLKRLGVQVHQELESVVSEIVYLTVPVTVRVVVQGGVDDREDDVNVFANEVDDVFVVPVIKGAFGDLYGE